MINAISTVAMAWLRVNLGLDTLKLNLTFWSILERQHGSTGGFLTCILAQEEIVRDGHVP
jgi:hypothetical protein